LGAGIDRAWGRAGHTDAGSGEATAPCFLDWPACNAADLYAGGANVPEPAGHAGDDAMTTFVTQTALGLALKCLPPALAPIAAGIALHENPKLDMQAVNHNANGTRDYGLAQINSANFGWLSVSMHTPVNERTIFDPCINLQASMQRRASEVGSRTVMEGDGLVETSDDPASTTRVEHRLKKKKKRKN
jgi:hypothetical protein